MPHELERLSTIGRPLMTMPAADQLVADAGHREAGVVGTVARYVDDAADAAHAAAWRAGPWRTSAPRRSTSCAPARSARLPAGRRTARAAAGLSMMVQGMTTVCAGRPRPLHVGDGDAPVRPRGDGLLHLGIAQGLHVAVALQALLVHVHGQRHVHGQDQLEVDGRLRSAAPCGRSVQRTDTSTKSNDFRSKAGMSGQSGTGRALPEDASRRLQLHASRSSELSLSQASYGVIHSFHQHTSVIRRHLFCALLRLCGPESAFCVCVRVMRNGSCISLSARTYDIPRVCHSGLCLVALQGPFFF